VRLKDNLKFDDCCAPMAMLVDALEQ